MGRGKLTVELIEKEKARMITYQKRKRGLKKKTQELSTLCGVSTCMIIYGPQLNNHPPDVDVWPEDQKDFMAVVNLYRDKAFSSIHGVKSQNLFNFFTDRKRKVDYKIAKTRKANYESKFSSDCDDLNQFSIEQLQKILAMLDYNLDVATRKLTMMKGRQILIKDSRAELFVGGCSNNNAPLAQAQSLFQKKMGVIEVSNRQPPIPSVYMQQRLSQYYPSDHHHTLQMVPLDLNPIDNPMMVMVNGGDQMGNSPYIPVQPAMIDHRTLMMNNPGSGVQSFGSLSMQPSPPYTHLPSISSQIHISYPLNEVYGDINKFLQKSQTRENSCKYEYDMGFYG